VVDRDLERLDARAPEREGQDVGVVAVGELRRVEGSAREGAVAGPGVGEHAPSEQRPEHGAGDRVAQPAVPGAAGTPAEEARAEDVVGAPVK
jgi:hypothetical protein